MKDYTTDKIRNVCLMGHGNAGKTTLAEAMMFNTGSLERFGKVTDGTTTLDFDPEEIKRKISISTAIGPCEWNDYKINIIDTPGYFDFVGEVKQGLRVADGALILVSAKSGVAVGTEKAWENAKESGIPALIFVNKMDDENANFFNVLEQMNNTFGKGVVAFQVPIMDGAGFAGFVDIVDLKAYTFRTEKMSETQIPENLKDKISAIRDQLNEVIAETDEALMEKFFAGEEFTHDEFHKGLRAGICDGSIVPAFCGSAAKNFSVKYFMDAVCEYMPSPADRAPEKAKKTEDGPADIELKAAPGEPVSALVFKTIADPFVGKLSIFRVYSGTMKSNSTVFNTTSEKQERISQLFVLKGKKQIPVDKLVAGDIGAVAKLQATNTNDTLCDQSKPLFLKKIEFPEPVIALAVEPKAKGDEEKISSGLHRLLDEDPTFRVEINPETHQTLIRGIGEQHLDIIVSKLKSKFGVSVNLTEQKVPYRETIKKKVKVEGKHKKQSGGHGQYGHVWIEFEHGDKEALVFEEKIFGGSVPKQYHPAVEKGLQESIIKGVLAGYPVVNLKATLVDGSYHDVDSSEMAFKIAAHLAFKKGLTLASPVLLEPIAHAEVYVPESFMGDIIGDLNKRRGRILGMNPDENGLQQIVAEVPEAEMFKYATDLKSMTQGRGSFKLWFERYEEAPPLVAQKVIDEAKKHMTAEEDE